MKNIWKLFMVAMMAFAIVACQQPGTSTDDDSSATPASSVAADSSSTAASSTPDAGNSSTPESGDSSTPESGDSSTPEGGDSSTPEGGDSSTPEGDDSSSEPDPISTGNNIYYFDVSVDNMDDKWGIAPRFSIFMCSEAMIAGLQDETSLLDDEGNKSPQAAPSGMAGFQVKMEENMSFDAAVTSGSVGVFDVEARAFYNNCLIAEVISEGKFRLWLDVELIKDSYLYCLGTDFGGEGAWVDYKDLETTAITYDPSALVPCVIALEKDEEAEERDDFVAGFWSAQVFKMTKASEEIAATIPENPVKDDAAFPEILSIEDIDSIVGTLNGWAINDGIMMDGEDTATGMTYEYTTEAAETAQFVFIPSAVADWKNKCGLADEGKITIGEATELKTLSGDAANIQVDLAAETTYIIKYYTEGDKAYVLVSVKEP